jgi:hypothetical protein
LISKIVGIDWVDIDIMWDVNHTKFRNRRLRKYENVEDVNGSGKEAKKIVSYFFIFLFNSLSHN